MDIRRILLTLRQQIWLLLGLTLATLTLFLMIPQLGKKIVYVSRAKILLTPQRSSGLTDGGRGMDTGNWLADEQTLAELVTSERLLSRICQTCNLRTPWQDLREQVRFEPLSQDYARRVSLFLLSVGDAEPKQAQKLTEAAVQEFVSYVEELSAREFANTRRFLEELVAEAKEKVDDTEEKLLTITSAHSDTADSANTATTLNTLDIEKRKLQEDIAVLSAETDSVRSYMAGQSSVLPTTLSSKSDSSLTQMESSLTAARLKLIELEQLYTAQNIQVTEQRARVQKLQQIFDERAQQYAESVTRERTQALDEKRKALSSVDARMSELRNKQLTPSEKRQVAKLERQLNMWEENHLNLVKQLYQARVVEQSSRRQGAITVVESPGPGLEEKEKRTRTLAAQIALGLPFSLAFAVSIVFVLDFVGASMRLVPKIENTLGLPVMAVIPPVDPELGELWEQYKREETLPRGLPGLLAEDNVPTSEV